MPTYTGIKFTWNGVGSIPSRSYDCGHCGNHIATERGWYGTDPHGHPLGNIAICHQCTFPTFFSLRGLQLPGRAFGGPVSGITEKSVEELYEEARRSTSAGCFTAAVLSCRKLLMHIAVSKGAAPNLSFAKYVDHLADKNYIPPDAKAWVDHIRTRSNEANHEIVLMSKEDAEELVSFSEMLLKVIYEFPAAIAKRLAKTPGT